MHDRSIDRVGNRPDRYFDHVWTAAGRAVTEQSGIRTSHTFSAGAHYDPANVAHGPVIGCDEHVVEPGAGFGRHAHRGVVIISWVLAGTLLHEGIEGDVELVAAGEVLVQSAGPGITHRETNPSDDEVLRFVQTTLLLDADRAVVRPDLPLRTGDLVIDIVHPPVVIGAGFCVVGAGAPVLDGLTLGPGDSLRPSGPVELGGGGELLTVAFGG